ncbi:MAG: hypothetical protein WD205_00235, partial [Rhodothermales bacterium]
ICGAVRLARFNVAFDGVKRDYFIGLPTPGMAVIIVAIILNFNDVSWFSEYGPGTLSILIPLVIGLSLLMISTMRFDAIPKPSAAYIRKHPRKAAAYGLGLMLVIVLQQVGLLIALSTYVLINIILALNRLVRQPPDEDDFVEDDANSY